jgi:hypothetical protein
MSADIAQLAAAHAELLRHLGDVIRSLWDARMLQTLQTELGQDASAITANIFQLAAQEKQLRDLIDQVTERLDQAQGTMH